jgi:hypothetical protein
MLLSLSKGLKKSPLKPYKNWLRGQELPLQSESTKTELSGGGLQSKEKRGSGG